MPFRGTINADLTPIFVELDNKFGAFVIDPGYDPCILLDVSLEDSSKEELRNKVKRVLQDFCNSLTLEYFLFPMVKFYEDLVWSWNEEESNIIILGKYQSPPKQVRCWTCGLVQPGRYRLIGS